MNEIELPCCGARAVLEDGANAIECEACNLVLELAPDAAIVDPRVVATLLAAA